MFIDNKYKLWYFSIIEKAKAEGRRKADGYFEKHHIVPKSLNGSDGLDNLVLLTAREHYVCHKLLTKFTDGVARKKMLHAWWSFVRASKNQDRVIVRSRDYNLLRATISAILSAERKGIKKQPLTEEHKKRLSDKLKGKSKSELTRARMKESWKNRGPRSEQHRIALSVAAMGRVIPASTREKMSLAKKGVNPIHTQAAWECPHCGKQGVGLSNYSRWHGDNCRSQINA